MPPEILKCSENSKNKKIAKNPISNVLWKQGKRIAKKRFTVPVNNVNSNLKISEPAEFPY